MKAEASGGAQAPTSLAEPDGGVLRIPAPVAERRTVPFPLVMALAPVVVAVVLWLLLGSPAMLAFAVLGPVLAVASYLEARRQTRAEHAKAEASFDRELQACIRQAGRRARDELIALQRSAPGARAVVAGTRVLRVEAVSLGNGPVKARVQFQGELGELSRSARAELDQQTTHQDAPVLVDAATVAVTGPRQLVLAAGRALVVQTFGSPAELGIAGGEVASSLADELDAAGVPWFWIRDAAAAASGARGLLLELGGRHVLGRQALSSTLPSPVVRLHVEDTSTARVELSRGDRLSLRPALVTAEELRNCSLGDLTAAGAGRPSGVQLSREVRNETNARAMSAAAQGDRGRSSLYAVVGTQGEAPFGIDLVGAGPHAVIGGTTGSGKSELLMTWVLAMTEARSSREVQVLCFDFKGGATFDPIATLPHCVGIVTDLDAEEARRAAISLGSEVRERELSLRRAGVPDISRLPGLARLVIVVDEYQALVDAGADLQEVFADISARGRSLGMHLVLCAQQPAVAVRGATLANCGVRVCLRVISDADSTALIGNASAARLPSSSPGRALVAAGDRITEIQVQQRERRTIARLTEAAIEREAHLRHAAPGRPWLPALPQHVDLAGLSMKGSGIPFGLLDDTVERRQSSATLDTALGALIVIGGPRTGKSACLAVLVEAARAAGGPEVGRATVLDSNVERAWDQLFAEDLQARRGLLVIDDVDALLAGIDEPHRTAVTDQLVRLIRKSASASPALVLSLTRVSGATAPLVAAVAQTLRLVGGDRASFVMAGGEGSEHRADAPPGRAVWRGLSCQVARARQELPALSSAVHASSSVPAPAPQPVEGLNEKASGMGRELLVVARGRASIRHLLEARSFQCVDLAHWRTGIASATSEEAGEQRDPAGRRAVVGDLESWQSQFGALSRLSTDHRVLLSGVTPGEHRAIFRGDPLPPLTTDPSRSAILRDCEGGMTRVRWADSWPADV
ncbi:FtsK/SpoIIIE domain-containing protein [Pseudoclavibacter sp. AY1F1]|uniref:FtsK/SpoIIIE domain-containing protein n=1 Tax=Pseudoclavibacter sp. AY1F1 TaxID=2080583 RepID=UPI0015E2AFAB|nr:FtsK/SpoIIIE domain-containing protein [Pseudoclavibacter sp. AY1F1]